MSSQLDPATLRAQILPSLRSKEELSARSRRTEAEGRGGIVAFEFCGDMVTVFLVEFEGSWVWVDEALLAEADLGDELFELALDNLRARTDAPLPMRVLHASHPGVFVVDVDDDLNSGRVLLHDLWKPIADGMEGELLVRVATRSVVIYCTNKEQDTVFAHLAAGFPKKEAAVTQQFIAWHPRGWAEIELPFELPEPIAPKSHPRR